jgi:kynureninase
MLTEVDYRTGRLHDMARLTAKAHAAGALTVWDLAHSAGAIAVDVGGAGADFAVGCTYKYLNGGPGAPAFSYLAPHMVGRARNPLQGWLGHAAPFAFAPDYAPAPGVAGMRIGTPPVIALEALATALDVWDGVDLQDLRARSIALSQAFIAGVEALDAGLTLAAPRVPEARGSQVSFRHPQAYAICRALIARGVIGDFRMPDVLRFGFAPLYVSPDDVARAVEILGEIMHSGAWDRPEFHARAAVT